MGLNDLVSGAPIVGSLAAVVGLIFTLLSIRTSAGVSLRNQRISVITHCNSRYDQIYQVRSEITRNPRPPDSQDNAISEQELEYFRRYWGLQSDQIDYWLDGYVDPDTMASWLASMADNLRGADGRKIGRTTYEESWKHIKPSHIGPNNVLVSMVTSIQELNSRTHLSEEDRFKEIIWLMLRIEELERKFIKQVSRNRIGRYWAKMLIETMGDYQRQGYRRMIVGERFRRWLGL